jgi:hypothetical protein
MKIYFFSLLIILSPFFSSAQNSAAVPANSSDTIPAKKILIIPYDPKMHLSDADRDMAEYSEKNQEQIRSMFRMGFMHRLHATVATVHPTYSLLEDLRPETMRELERIYASVDYSFDTVYSFYHPRYDSLKSKAENKKAQKIELERKKASGDLRYINVHLKRPMLIAELNQNFGADLIVFVTQVEIKTDRTNCAGIDDNNYTRDLKVNYSVFDKNGKQLDGDIAIIHYPSNSNDIGSMMSQNFPSLATIISASLK